MGSVEREVIERRDNVVIKSPNDRKSYRILHLPNGLTALLVHDPEIYPESDPEASRSKGDGDDAPTKKAAAAMCVGMGSFSDPSNAQGLAHFLEHMLFMGSSEFPDENEYESYLSKHGGSCNAYTESEHTCYYFEVNRGHLKGALMRFSQFFISPLVKVDSMEREVLAVDSEFNRVQQNDNCRLQQLQSHTALPNHPLNRFTWGNKKSLVDAMENGVNLREEILKMFNNNYNGEIMELVVIGGESLNILDEWVVELFSNVKKGHESKMSTICGKPIWKSGKRYRLEAVKDVHVLELSWSLPCLHREYLKKPTRYISHLMGHEGKGSLFSYLKAKGWVSSLYAGVGSNGMCCSSIVYIFSVYLCLTDSGLDKIHAVIDAVYQYIKLLQQSAPQEWIFRELQDIANMKFKFAEQQPQDDYAITLAENMRLYSEEHIIYGGYAFEQWDPKLIESIIRLLSPENMRIDIMSKSFDKQSQAIKYEPWFGSSYIEEDIPASLLETWRNPAEIHPSLHFPLKNEFIPCDFSLCNADKTKHVNMDYPQCIIDEPLVKLWYKNDSIFNVPRANSYFLITVKKYSSVQNALLVELFVDLLNDELNEMLYQASVAKLWTSLSTDGENLSVMLYGFNDKLCALLSKILSSLKSFCPNNDRFKVIKEDMERAYRNANMNPMSHASYLLFRVLCESYWDVDDLISCLDSLSLSDVKTFIPDYLSELHIEGICHGNLSQEEAIYISNIFTNVFSAKPLPVQARHKKRLLQLPMGARLVKNVRVKNDLEVNSVVQLYFQIEQVDGIESKRLSAITSLFRSIIAEPCFTQLRTKEQLGYVVHSVSWTTYHVLGFCFTVQSSQYNPLHLQSRIENFINDIHQLLDNLDGESFENHKKGLIAKILEKDPSLIVETGRYWSEITDQRYIFNMSKLVAEELKTIQKTEVINWYNTYLKPSSPKCRKLAIHVWGCNAKMDEVAQQTEQFGQVIEDVDLFKSSCEYYPSLY